MPAFTPRLQRIAFAALSGLSCVALAMACGDVLVEPLKEPKSPSDAGADAAGGVDGSPCGSPPFAACAGECVHLLTNDTHCGQCNQLCATGFHCVAGACQLED
jgi:Stigma-specific protein, Stig1